LQLTLGRVVGIMYASYMISQIAQP
jgi:hypothetical protein